MTLRYSPYATTTILLLLAATSSHLSSAVSAENTLQPRIVGGKDADFNEYPFFASWGKSCGATLIHDDILLTAAHVSRDNTNKKRDSISDNGGRWISYSIHHLLFDAYIDFLKHTIPSHLILSLFFRCLFLFCFGTV